jgi:hypothetical protein
MTLCTFSNTVGMAVHNGVSVVVGKGGDWESESQERKLEKSGEHFLGTLMCAN